MFFSWTAAIVVATLSVVHGNLVIMKKYSNTMEMCVTDAPNYVVKASKGQCAAACTNENGCNEFNYIDGDDRSCHPFNCHPCNYSATAGCTNYQVSSAKHDSSLCKLRFWRLCWSTWSFADLRVGRAHTVADADYAVRKAFNYTNKSLNIAEGQRNFYRTLMTFKVWWWRTLFSLAARSK